MIKNIIKRNGKIEPFAADKVNGWGEWAAKTLGGHVDWASAVLHTVNTCPESVTSEQLQDSLIDYCLAKNTWEYSRMAGRLYASKLSKQFYGARKPTVQALHKRLQNDELMVALNYADEDYVAIEAIIDHSRDLKLAQYQIHQIRHKYALRNKISNVEYEMPQFVYMRMAMALAEKEQIDRLVHVKNFYDLFSQNKLNPPTPNFVNLGTKHNGYASCCVYTTDDTAPSLAAGDHIAYVMTYMSSGIGGHIKTRSLGDPIRGGLIEHQGKLPYYRALVGAIGANLQNGRGGAATMHYTAFDPEVQVIQKLRNPMTPALKQVKGIDYSFGSNKVFARKVARDENYSLFSYSGNKELYAAQYEDSDKFAQLYAEYEASGKAAQVLPARQVLVDAIMQAYETGRHYLHQMDTMNHHTPFKEPIYSSNLCQEIALSTKAFKNAGQLYESWNKDHGEIALCSLGGAVVDNIDSDEEHALVCYYALKMIDVCVHKSTYPFKSLEHTAKSRMSAGVGVLGLAHLMAKKNLKYSTLEGRNFIHELFESHEYHLIKASLRISKERGLAPWMNKTKWPEGWLPIDTYEKRVDELVTVGLKRDWETLRAEIIENKGIGHTVLSAHMPGESSTIAAGTTNGVYPIRDFDLMKTNDTLVTRWVAPGSTKLRDKYELSWDVGSLNMIKCYAVMQKFTDQTISADLWRRVQGDQKVGTSEIIEEYLEMVKYGMKTRYYLNSLTAKGVKLNTPDQVIDIPEDSPDEDASCEGCSL